MKVLNERTCQSFTVDLETEQKAERGRPLYSVKSLGHQRHDQVKQFFFHSRPLLKFRSQRNGLDVPEENYIFVTDCKPQNKQDNCYTWLIK